MANDRRPKLTLINCEKKPETTKVKTIVRAIEMESTEVNGKTVLLLVASLEVLEGAQYLPKQLSVCGAILNLEPIDPKDRLVYYSAPVRFAFVPEGKPNDPTGA